MAEVELARYIAVEKVRYTDATCGFFFMVETSGAHLDAGGSSPEKNLENGNVVPLK